MYRVYYVAHLMYTSAIEALVIAADVRDNVENPREKCHFCHIFLDNGRRRSKYCDRRSVRNDHYAV